LVVALPDYRAASRGEFHLRNMNPKEFTVFSLVSGRVATALETLRRP